MSDKKKENGFPSTAFISPGHPDADPANKEYVPCRLNQPLYYQDRNPQPFGQKEHGVRPGYCSAHKRLGCESEECR